MKWVKFDKTLRRVFHGATGRQLLPELKNMEEVTQLSHGKGIGKSFWRTKMLELLAL